MKTVDILAYIRQKIQDGDFVGEPDNPEVKQDTEKKKVVVLPKKITWTDYPQERFYHYVKRDLSDLPPELLEVFESIKRDVFSYPVTVMIANEVLRKKFGLLLCDHANHGSTDLGLIYASVSEWFRWYDITKFGNEFTNQYMRQISSRSQFEYWIKVSPLAVFDDLGLVSPATGFHSEELTYVIDTRRNLGLPTIFLTSKTKQELDDCFARYFVGRLESGSIIDVKLQQ